MIARSVITATGKITHWNLQLPSSLMPPHIRDDGFVGQCTP